MASVALTIAGSDPSGGAGIQADLKTFQAHRVYGTAVVSLLTVQNSLGVTRVAPVEAELIAAQLAAVLDDIPPAAAKTGALPHPEALALIARAFRGRDMPLVVDPILSASSGQAFASVDMASAYLATLIPAAALVTPNAVEAELLTGCTVRDLAGAEAAATRLLELGARAVLLKGGHLPGEPTDLLLCADGTRVVLPATRIATAHTHGTGCTYAAAITARLARGESLVAAVTQAKAWLARVIASPLGLGRGRGPLNHLIAVDSDD